MDAGDYLKLARKSQKDRKWKEAAQYYEQYIYHHKAQCEDRTFVAFARSLRLANKITKAKKVLLESDTLFPQNEKILSELFNLYDTTSQWEKAKKVAETLIKINPNEAKHYFKLGRTYSFLRDNANALKTYETGLGRQHGMSFEQLIEKIQFGFTDDFTKMQSEYKFIQGKNNLGVIIHKDGERKYFTKISRATKGSRDEELFYREVVSKFPVLINVVPKYIDSQIIDNIVYLTIEMIDAVPKRKLRENIDKIVATAQQISSVRYEQIITSYPNPHYSLQLNKRAISLVPFFTQIHLKHVNEKLFTSLQLLSMHHLYTDEAVEVITQLEAIVMGNQSYQMIEPEKHYSLIHGDFIPGNMDLLKTGSTLKVFDWATYKIGLSVIDIVMYFVGSNMTYDEVNEGYLLKNELNKLDQLEKIYFLIIYILMHYIKMDAQNNETEMKNMILPALKDLHMFVSQFKAESYQKLIQMLADERIENQEELDRLKRKIANLKKDKQKLTKRYKEIEGSKFWRLTAPLRKLNQLRVRWFSKNS